MPRGYKKGNIPVQKGKGRGIAAINAALVANTDACIEWPLSKNPESGYGTFGYLGEFYFAHRYMCRVAHGEKPTPKHEVRHLCHNKGCINPRHLKWGTHAENIRDKVAIGTNYRPTPGRRAKLTPEQVREARALKGKLSQAKIGRMFGVCEASIRSLHKGRTYPNVA